jgi:hypothetical protein
MYPAGSRKRATSFVVIALVLATFGAAAIAVGQPAQTLRVSVNGTGVSLEAVDVPLDQVLRKLGEAMRARIIIETVLASDLAKTRVTRSFTDLPAVQAFGRLLVGRNYALMQGPGGVDEVRVFVDGSTGYRDLTSAARSAPRDRRAAVPSRTEEPVDDPAEVARLRQAALNASDPSARREALEELSTMNDTTMLKDTLIHVLARERDGRVLETVLALGAQHDDALPVEALRSFVTSDRDATVRTIALDHLVSRGGNDPLMRNLLSTLAASDASEEMRDAAKNALESLEPPATSSPTRR